MARNTDLVKAEDAPKGYRDLLDPKWAGKIVKAHPGYSGTILTATYQTARDVGWDYYEKLAKQRVMQVQSASDPPKKLALGERAIMADGIEYGVFQLKETGKPVDVIYPVEGSPLIIGPNGILKSAPNPNAARLFQSFMLSAECQQFNVEFGGLRTAHALVKDKPGRKPMKDIKIMKDDAAAVEKRQRARSRRATCSISRCEVVSCANRLSRRDVLKGSGALALGLSSTTKVLSAAPPASAVTPELIAAAKKEGKVVYYTSIDLPLAEKIAKSFEAKYPGHRRARRAHRRRARVPAHRPGICEPHLRRRCGELVRRRALHRLEARRAAGALRAGGRRAALSGRPQGRRRLVRELPRRA